MIAGEKIADKIESVGCTLAILLGGFMILLAICALRISVSIDNAAERCLPAQPAKLLEGP